MKLSIKTWQQVEPLLTTAFDMEAPERAAWLDALDTTHPEVAPVLRRMLAAHDLAESRRELETVPRIAPPPPWSSAYSPGARIGPFELVRPIGHGGMGEVWLARQADGRIEREVALKLPALHQGGELWRERFKRERDILAKLEHPNIAHLYDAGVTDSGQPWLAMELVVGETLSAHVAARSPSPRERLALFRQILSAVAHAHRHLVVHRDLKPANILIDASGHVKLLDFGIAKLVDEAADASGDLTRLGGRVMTLRYAAPEQVAGEPVTTATDVYALGVILHEILTGLSPYRPVREGKLLTEAMLLREEIAVPHVSGDLDAILLKALRRDPAARYASVEAFDDDILAHLERRPVKARAGTWRYLAGRFAARHKLPLAAAAAVLVTLVGGLVMAERERRVAVAEKARAEKHFASVRKLANTFIFEVHSKIENLPGSLEAREMLIRTSLEYLDALAAESGRDPALTAEIAAAYRNIGNIQGQAGRAHKGDYAASIPNYEKSKRLYAELERAKPGDIAVEREYRKLSYSLTRAQVLLGDPRWEAEMAETLRLSERVASAPGASVADRSFWPLARIEKTYITSLTTGAAPADMAAFTSAIAEVEALVREAPGDVDLRERLASVYQRAGTLHGYFRGNEGVREAIAYQQKAQAMVLAARAEKPADASKQALAVSITHDLAMMYRRAGELPQADRAMVEAVAMGRDLYARDPADADVAAGLVNNLSGACHLAISLGDLPRAISLAREALAVAARLPDQARNSSDVRASVANAQAGLGYALFASADRAAGDRGKRRALLMEARSILAEAMQYLQAMRAANQAIPFLPEDVKNFEETVKRCDEAIARLQAA